LGLQRFSDEEIGNDLSLGRQQRAKPRRAWRHAKHIGGDEPLPGFSGAVANNLDDPAGGEEGPLRKLCPWRERSDRKTARRRRRRIIAYSRASDRNRAILA